jgi:hypothetical protein
MHHDTTAQLRLNKYVRALTKIFENAPANTRLITGVSACWKK